LNKRYGKTAQQTWITEGNTLYATTKLLNYLRNNHFRPDHKMNENIDYNLHQLEHGTHCSVTKIESGKIHNNLRVSRVRKDNNFPSSKVEDKHQRQYYH